MKLQHAIMDEAGNEDDGGLLDVGALVKMFEESEDATSEARIRSENDRDYYDNRHWTPRELAVLKKRGQPGVVDNIIKTKVDYLDGVEKKQRIDPKALPRTPKHEAEASAATEALRYVTDSENYDKKRSAVWRDMLVEGCGGIRVTVEPGKDYNGQGALDVKIHRVAWDRMFFDPHSSEPDFSDAGYLGVVIWMNYDDALAQYPDGKEALDTTLSSAPSDTYDDKPKFNSWGDRKRKRVRICQIWIRRDDVWHFAEFTKGGILKSGPSPFVNDKGESDCELFFQSAYVDRDNNRYGFVRELTWLQDEVNKRRSKSLHLLSVNQLHYEDGAFMDNDIERARKELARPDGTIRYAPNALAEKRAIVVNGVELATAHFQLLQEAKNAIDLKGPNATEMGDKTGGSNAASGRAIIASQQGGMTQLAHLTDRLRNLDVRVFRAIWARIRQFWTAEKWIRVTDDEQNVRWVGLNVDPAQMQMAMQQNPALAQRVAGVVGSVAELDCDIIIDEAPDSLTSPLEQFEALVELKKYDANGEIPLKSIIRASPNLKVKQQLLKDMEEREAAQSSPQEQQIKLRGVVAEIENKEADTQKKLADARATIQEAALPQRPQQMEPFAAERAMAEIEEILSSAKYKQAQAHKAAVDAALAPAYAAHEAQHDWANFDHSVMKGLQDREAAALGPQAA
jgi:hypothetical protein